jgi:putative nucleotidyltransferase with HDIG domain
MFSHITPIITFVALIYYTVLLFIILNQNIHSRVRLFFSLYLMAMMVWSFTGFMIFSGVKIAPSLDTLFWNRALVVGVLIVPVAFFGFVESFLMLDRRVWLYVALVSLLVAQVANLFGLVVISASVSGDRLNNVFGDGETLAGAIWAFFFVFSAIELINAYRKSRDYLFRNRIKYLFLVTLVIFVGSLTNLTDLKYYPGDIVFNILAAFLITIAILRHRLLDFSLVVRKGLLYAIPTLIIGVSYYLVIQITLKFLTAGGVSVFLLTLLVAMLSALTVQPLQDLAQNWIDRIFFREKHDANLMLQRISRTAAYVLDIDEITQMILDEITHTLHIDQAAFFLKRAESGEFYLASSKGLEEKVDVHWDSSHPIVRSLSNFDHALTRHDLSVMPQFRSLWGEDREVLEKIWAELLIPLKVKGELVGFFTVGPKSSREIYTDDDQLTLMTLANQMAVAIENAHLYSAEQSRREEMDTLYHLSRQLVAIDEVNEILQTTIRYVVKSVHVTFARALLLDEHGEFICRAAFPIRALDHDLGEGRIDPPAAKLLYLRAIARSEPTLLTRNDPSLTDDERHALLLDQVASLCLSPLRVGDQAVGLFVLGERREALRESFDADKVRLIGSMADQAASALRRANLHEQMEDNFLETVLALANAMDARDSYTINHSQRLASMAEAICVEMSRSEDEIKAIHWAALLHDLGKIGVPDSILLKAGVLTEEEWVIMKKHPEIGARIVAPVKKLANVSPIIRAHQERYDGNGYPDGLKGEQIPFGARLLAIVDAYGAMTDERIYRKTRIPTEAIKELIRCKGTQFDPELVDRCIAILKKLSASNEAMNHRLNTPASQQLG